MLLAGEGGGVEGLDVFDVFEVAGVGAGAEDEPDPAPVVPPRATASLEKALRYFGKAGK